MVRAQSSTGCEVMRSSVPHVVNGLEPRICATKECDDDH